MASAAVSGSPSQPWPKLTTARFTRPMCSSAASAISSGRGVKAMRSWVQLIPVFFCSERHPRQRALQVTAVGSGAS